MTDRKKPGVWATVVLVVVLAYPLSWALYLHCLPEAYALPDELSRKNLVVVAWGVYAPLFWSLKHAPEWLYRPLAKYESWLMKCSGALVGPIPTYVTSPDISSISMRPATAESRQDGGPSLRRQPRK